MYYIIVPDEEFYNEGDDQLVPFGLAKGSSYKIFDQFDAGEKIAEECDLIFSFSGSKQLLDKYLTADFLLSNPALFSKRLVDLILMHSPNDIQALPVVIKSHGADYSGFFAINFMKRINCLDMEKSKFYRMLPSDNNSPLVLQRPVFLDGTFDDGLLGVADHAPSLKVASEKFIHIYRQEKMIGMDFWPNNKPPN